MKARLPAAARADGQLRPVVGDRSNHSRRRCWSKKGFAVPDPADAVQLRRQPPELEASAAELFEIGTSGEVRIEVKQRFALDDAAEAHRAPKHGRRPVDDPTV